MKLPDSTERLSAFLAEPEVHKAIRDMLADSMHGISVAHQVIHLPDFAHVDPAILDDIRNQGYHLFERFSALNVMLHIIVEKQSNEFILKLFAHTFCAAWTDEEGFKRLCKNTTKIYAPALWESGKKP